MGLWGIFGLPEWVGEVSQWKARLHKDPEEENDAELRNTVGLKITGT